MVVAWLEGGCIHGLIQRPPVPTGNGPLLASDVRAHQSSCLTCVRSITRHDQRSFPPKIPIKISPEVFHILTPRVDCFAPAAQVGRADVQARGAPRRRYLTRQLEADELRPAADGAPRAAGGRPRGDYDSHHHHLFNLTSTNPPPPRPSLHEDLHDDN
eukprot:scaffold106149_cov20-Prasinocladus_malaysianus.AAC.1